MDSAKFVATHSEALRRGAWLTGIAGVVSGSLGIGFADNLEWVNFFDNLHWTSATLATAILSWLAWQQRSLDTEKTTSLWMAWGATGYALGQITWDIQIVLGYSSFPSPADAFYLALGPCVTIAFLKLLGQKVKFSLRSPTVLDAVTISVAVLTLTLVLYLPKRGNTDGLALLTLISYPSTLLAAVAVMFITALTIRLRITMAFVALFAGLFVTALTWMWWNFLALDGKTIAGSWMNVGFSIAILLVGYGLTNWDQSVDESKVWDRTCEGILRLLPLLSVAIASGTIVLANLLVDLPVAITESATIGAVIVTVMATLRQGVLLRDRDELMAAQHALNISQSALVREQAHLKTVLTTIPDLVWLKDPDGIYISCNKAFENFFGADEVDIVGKTDYDFAPKELADSFRENDKLAINAAGGRRNEETLTFSRGGYQGVFETIKTPMRDESGKLVGVLGIARDISERKRSEEQLSIQAGILANLTEGIHLAKADTLEIVYANRQLESLFGYPPGELTGKHVSVLNEPGIIGAEELVRHILSSLELTGAWDGDVRNVRKDGTAFWTHASVSSFQHPEHGKVWISVHEDATARKQNEAEVQNLAFYDPLTQLPNRRLMMDRARQAIANSTRTGLQGALILLDLDDFKLVNDTLGHDVGDQLLVAVAARLVKCVREGDTVSRLGGDEFVIILGGLDADENGPVQAEHVARKILASLAEDHVLATAHTGNEPQIQRHQCTPSIGICMFNRNGLGVDELLKRADTAMYQAKRAGRNCICFYDPKMQELIRERAILEDEIRQAILNEEFVIYFQAQVNEHGKIVGAEVLVRWHHPARGIISPGVFIPVAEESGQILQIGDFVLKGACRQLADWSKDPVLATITLSVNVSARQMSHPDFGLKVESVIAEEKIVPERLKLELTEGLLLTNTEEVIGKMERLRAHGVHFSLDDFGTGFSSLSYLKRLPLDQLKIDQSFVRDLLSDPNDEAIAKTVIALGHSLGLTVVAEGVELEEQHRLLRQFGCDSYQGYLFGRPMPVAEFESLVRS